MRFVRTLAVTMAGLCWLLLAITVFPVPASAQENKAGQPGAESATPPADDTDTNANSADKLSLTQQQIAEKFRHLEQVLLRMSELTAGSDPRRAALLKKTVEASGQRLVDLQFETLVELLRKDKLSRALENQENLGKDLQTLLQLLLSEDRAKRIDAEKTRIRKYLKRLNLIIKQQKDIQGRTQGRGDPKAISGEQGQLAEKTGGLAKDIKENEEGGAQAPDTTPAEQQEKPDSSDPKDTEGEKGTENERKTGEKDEDKDNGKGQEQETTETPGQNEGEPGGKPQGQPQSPSEGQQQPGQQKQGPSEAEQKHQQPQQQQDKHPSRQRLQSAQQRMKEAQEQLDKAQREGAVEKQEEAIRELQQAKAELEEILRQLREEEITRMLAMLEARFHKMLQMQREVYDGTTRLDKVPQPQRSHNHEIEASRLSGKETEIVVQCDKALLLLHEDGTAVAFPEAIGQMRDDMQQVVLRLAETKVGKITQAIEEDIIATLGETIEALKKAQKDRGDKKQQQGQPPPGEPQDPPLVDRLAELRMIRALQMRINRRTQRYSQLIEGEQADTRDVIEALKRLAQREQRIYRVTRDLEQGRNK